ncbi:MAG: hypothetical protein JW902_04130 [Syntrophaceae bacterium]|nr:hypothetical protein [Syntrophaceae bacterium]
MSLQRNLFIGIDPVCYEHTAALDPKSAAQVAELTKSIIEQEKLTALMVTHSMQQASISPTGLS